MKKNSYLCAEKDERVLLALYKEYKSTYLAISIFIGACLARINEKKNGKFSIFLMGLKQTACAEKKREYRWGLQFQKKISLFQLKIHETNMP